MAQPDVTLTRAECLALYELISMLSGNNPEIVFAWDGTDDPSDATTAACAKIFRACGRKVPDNLRP